MACVIINSVAYDIIDGSSLSGPCRAAGVPFNCHSGACGSCLIEIVAGGENLSAPTEEEKDLGVGDKRRLACRCRINGGTVTIRF